MTVSHITGRPPDRVRHPRCTRGDSVSDRHPARGPRWVTQGPCCATPAPSHPPAAARGDDEGRARGGLGTLCHAREARRGLWHPPSLRGRGRARGRKGLEPVLSFISPILSLCLGAGRGRKDRNNGCSWRPPGSGQGSVSPGPPCLLLTGRCSHGSHGCGVAGGVCPPVATPKPPETPTRAPTGDAHRPLSARFSPGPTSLFSLLGQNPKRNRSCWCPVENRGASQPGCAGGRG